MTELSVFDIAIDANAALNMLEEAHEVADGYRATLNTLETSQVSHTIPLDLAYKGCQRAGAIGKAHHTAHYNFAVDELGKIGSATPKFTMAGLRAKYGRRGVWSALFNLTQHQAIGEGSYTKTAFAERLTNGMNLLNGIGSCVRVRGYTPTFSMVSPTKMTKSFTRFLESLDGIDDKIGSEIIHDEIATFLSQLSIPDLIDAEESRLLCTEMGFIYKQNPTCMQRANALVEKTDEMDWLTYFFDKGQAIVEAGLGEEVVGHLFTHLHKATTEVPGVLFATLACMDRLDELEDLFVTSRGLIDEA